MNRSLQDRTLLVLAASKYQFDAIQTAKRLGARVITVDNVPSNPGHRLADASYNVSTLNIPAVVEIARSERIHGVIAPCTDVSVPTQAAVAQALGLVGPTPEAAAICCDKVSFRKFQRRLELPHPRFVDRPGDDFEVSAEELNSRWIIKPTRSSGSKGVFILESSDDWRRRLPESRSYSTDGGVIIEEFIDGEQGTIEGVLENGKIVWSAVLDRETATPPFCATRGHRVPSRFPLEIQAELTSQLERVWNAVGYHFGTFDCDFVVMHNSVVLIEVAPRLGGNGIIKLLTLATDFPLAEFAIRHALGDGALPTGNYSAKPATVQILGAESAGRLLFDEAGAESLRQEPWLAELEWDVPFGTEVRQFQNGRDRVGAFYLTAPSREILDERIADAHGLIGLRTESSKAPLEIAAV